MKPIRSMVLLAALAAAAPLTAVALDVPKVQGSSNELDRARDDYGRAVRKLRDDRHNGAPPEVIKQDQVDLGRTQDRVRELERKYNDPR